MAMQNSDAITHSTTSYRRKKSSRLLWRLLNPVTWWQIFRLEKNRKKTATAEDDAQLQFYSEFLPSGFLHYGYFDNPDIQARDISLGMLESAQQAYAQKLLELTGPTDLPVLDAGCGMGGLLPLLEARSMCPFALTPDINQACYIRRKYPHIRLFHSRFENFPVEDFEQKIGSVITSESFQYMDMKTTVSLVEKLLPPGGRWIICDYFRTSESSKSSGHLFNDFMDELKLHDLRLLHQEDITINILPTLHFANLLAERLARPLLNLMDRKFRTKHPGFYFALTPEINSLSERIHNAMQSIDPAYFVQTKRYMLLALEKT